MRGVGMTAAAVGGGAGCLSGGPRPAQPCRDRELRHRHEAVAAGGEGVDDEIGAQVIRDRPAGRMP